MHEKPFDDLLSHIEELELTSVHGRITEVIGMLIKAVIPQVKLGEICLIRREPKPLIAEVVGFTKEEVFLSPLGTLEGIGPSSEVIPMKMSFHIKVGKELLGRVIDGLGEPLDSDVKGPLHLNEEVPIIAPPPPALKRALVTKPISVGVRGIDGLLTCGQGQRVGIFAGSGVGKSTLLGMIARYAQADVNVIALIGERGREVREFIEKDLGEDGLKRSVIIVSTSDQAAQIRINAAMVGSAIAEYFRDQGKSVILMMDSITRYARALREVGLAAGEPPARSGFTPSVFATLPKLLERSGNSDKGSITAFYTILVEGDDLNEPISDEVRSILDGHIVLSQKLAHQHQYPAIDLLRSISRVLPSIVPEKHLMQVGKVREALSNYEKNELLIRIGEYKPGSDPATDFAIRYRDAIKKFLVQKITDRSTYEQTLDWLMKLFT